MDKGCLPYILGFAVLCIIFSVLAKGEDKGAEGLIKFAAFILCIIGVYAVIKMSSKNRRR
jgi:hypothetical protein